MLIQKKKQTQKSQNDATCSGGAECDGFTGLCLFESCEPGKRGCRCQREGAPCEDGFVCNGDGACVESACTPGSAGCKCLANKQCNKKGFTCVELDRQGTQTMCVGQQLCGKSQTARCTAECGAGNVAACGQCTYSQPICRDATIQYCNPKVRCSFLRWRCLCFCFCLRCSFRDFMLALMFYRNFDVLLVSIFGSTSI